MSMTVWGVGTAARCSRIRSPRSSVWDGGAPAVSSAVIVALPWVDRRSRAGFWGRGWPSRLDRAGHLAEIDPGAVGTRGGGGEGDDVAVLEERPRRAVGQGQRLRAAPGQLDERAALVPLRPADGAR